ncbi:MAG: GNAT family N-acetyltransferase, partial [Nanoarchaeota archaeon]|nr:GNAT family N-acetyltransferase [Nanoarchaeota archaeon]
MILTIDEVPGGLELFLKLMLEYDNNYLAGWAKRRPYSPERISRIWSKLDKYNVLLDMEGDSEAMGFVVGSQGHVPQIGTIDHIYAKRRGAGRQLTARVETLLRERGATSSNASVYWNNQQALDFFQRTGYRLIG